MINSDIIWNLINFKANFYKMACSMNKSGKVRKQTPKVEVKIRIMKSHVGRAKKKSQYNIKKKYLLDNSKMNKIKFCPNKQD